MKYEEILRWRHATHPLGTLPFICAFLAKQDKKTNTERYMFSLNPALPTNNRRLDVLLSKGIAENHFHLQGSTSPFLLSWICLMNDVLDRKSNFDKIDKNPLTESLDKLDTGLYSLVLKAATIRAFLFSILNGFEDTLFLDIVGNKESTQTEADSKTEPCPYAGLEFILSSDTEMLESQIPNIQSIIESLKAIYGVTIDGFKPDYAIQNTWIDSEVSEPFIYFSGEIKFLYQMFQSILDQNPKILPYLDLFYAYLLISIRFRSELVQSNHSIGFGNFSHYEERKSDFISKPHHKPYKDTQKRIAALTNLKNKKVHSFEARIMPEESVTELSQKISDIDQIIFEDRSDKPYLELYSIPRNYADEKIFYVLHIGKCRSVYRDDMIETHCPRDHKLRLYTHKVADSIIELRNGCDSVASRIYGIDACSNEIGVRPEVFAPEFRRLKSHQPPALPYRENQIPMINITYHVGEDFLDMVDGLRAIWEAIEFFEMDRHDRIGHALALGVHPKNWYESKQYRVYLPRQDLLDNCIWMLSILGQNSEIDKRLIHELDEICFEQFSAIYHSQDLKLVTDEYFKSIKLRGDDPSIYNLNPNIDYDRYIERIHQCRIYSEHFLRNDIIHSELFDLRKDKHIATLNHYYHFSKDVKVRGQEVVEQKFSKLYVKAVSKLQEIMQKQIEMKGIGIETNPSSNILIGNFKRYDRHPLTRFYNRHLNDEKNKSSLFVSINTDDQGIFDTSLENEYAYMARGLEQKRKKNGKQKFSNAQIYDWLDDVRQMGLEQSFRKNQK